MPIVGMGRWGCEGGGAIGKLKLCVCVWMSSCNFCKHEMKKAKFPILYCKEVVWFKQHITCPSYYRQMGEFFFKDWRRKFGVGSAMTPKAQPPTYPPVHLYHGEVSPGYVMMHPSSTVSTQSRQQVEFQSPFRKFPILRFLVFHFSITQLFLARACVRDCVRDRA